MSDRTDAEVLVLLRDIDARLAKVDERTNGIAAVLVRQHEEDTSLGRYDRRVLCIDHVALKQRFKLRSPGE